VVTFKHLAVKDANSTRLNSHYEASSTKPPAVDAGNKLKAGVDLALINRCELNSPASQLDVDSRVTRAPATQ